MTIDIPTRKSWLPTISTIIDNLSQIRKAIKTSNLEDVSAVVNDYDVVAVDEGQFFQDIVSFSENLANKGKIVMIAALDGTFQKKPFGNILGLIPIAESVKKLSAVCVYCTK